MVSESPGSLWGLSVLESVTWLGFMSLEFQDGSSQVADLQERVMAAAMPLGFDVSSSS
jgi:hypothetical protein